MAATCKERMDTANWYWVVEIIQAEFRDGRLLEECMFQTVVILPNGGGGFRGGFIVKFPWKELSGVFNQWIGAAVNFHCVLHGFREFRGAGTASFESRMLQQLVKMRYYVL